MPETPSDAVPPLTPDEVHVWRADLDAQDEGRMRALLTEDERQRADRMRFARDRRRTAASRGVLRLLLARYLSRDPASLDIETGPAGKPRLADATLRFNVAHADGLALVALAEGRAVGVDVERVRDRADHEAIATRFFAPEEAAEIAALPPGRRLDAFFTGWVRKEAYLKATGEGIPAGLDRCRVTLDPDAPARITPPPGAGAWELRALEIDPGYAAALVVARKERPATCRRFEWRT